MRGGPYKGLVPLREEEDRDLILSKQKLIAKAVGEHSEKGARYKK